MGGRTSAIEGDGYRFDLGPTFFLYPQILEESRIGRPRIFIATRGLEELCALMIHGEAQIRPSRHWERKKEPFRPSLTDGVADSSPKSDASRSASSVG